MKPISPTNRRVAVWAFVIGPLLGCASAPAPPHHQLGIDLPPDEVDAMAAWMRSMTGEPDPAYVAPPKLPPG